MGLKFLRDRLFTLIIVVDAQFKEARSQALAQYFTNYI